jgi:hypothetical protein
MSQLEPINTEQPKNSLTDIADRIRKELLIKNDYGNKRNEYGATNKDALSDGDQQGRGTGVFLDTQNGGTITDVVERKEEIKINKYQPEKQYTKPTV